jgi:DNA-binding MarR family transcriptional regulator
MPDDNSTRRPRQDPASGAPRNTTALLGVAYQALGRRIVAGVSRAGYRQRAAHSAVFAHIDIEGGTRASTLAVRANLTPQAIGELVDDLERMGYVSRKPDPDDRRAKRVVLTNLGRAAVASAMATIEELERRLDLEFGAGRMDELHAMLARMAQLEERAGSTSPREPEIDAG